MKHNDGEYKPTVLIVDDEEEVLVSFNIWLDEEGFRTFTASNSTEAVKILEEERVEVAFLDFRLGGEDGLTVAKMFKKIDESLKIIIITGFPSHHAAVESMKSGIFDYLSKGESREKILDTLKEAVRSREMEILKKGEASPWKSFLKFIVICNHSLIKERLENFSLNYPDFKLMKTFNSLELLKGAEYVPEIDIAMVCATCCIETFADSFLFFNELYKVLPTVKPVLFNENFSKSQKVDLIKIGMKGFFSIDMDSNQLEKALSLIKKGDMWVSRKLTSLALPNGPEYLKNYLVRMQSHDLSSRERDILKAMIMGLKNKEIAERLFISENTVKTHITNIYKKFDVKNRVQAIRVALDRTIP